LGLAAAIVGDGPGDVATIRDANEGDGEGSGKAAVNAMPLPQVPRKTAAATTELITTSPRRTDQRIARGAASIAATLKMISAVPNELPAEALPRVASSIPMTAANKERIASKAARPAAIQLPIRITCGQLVRCFAFATHCTPSHRQFASAEMAGCHCEPSQKKRPSSDNLVVNC
jgi:hypothetical protein